MSAVSVHSTRFFFLMIRRPPRSTLDRSSAASDVYKRQLRMSGTPAGRGGAGRRSFVEDDYDLDDDSPFVEAVSYTHLRAHETVLDLVCRLLLEKKKKQHNIHLRKSLLIL